MDNKVPQLLKGFRDFAPDKMSARLFALATIRAAFERFGFAPMDTPALEYAETLTGKYGTEEKLLYKFQDNGGRDVAMRYDLTVPLARFYEANKNNLPKPFKRYCIGPVWRADNPQKGRYREFYQCDVDVVGSASPLADAECVAATATALSDLGVKDFKIRLNNRKIVVGFLSLVGVSGEKYLSAMRLLDKADKLPKEELRRLFKQYLGSGKQVDQLFKYLNISITSAKDLESVILDLGLEDKTLNAGLAELSEVMNGLAAMSVENCVTDFKLARGLDYYTGTVCEVVLSQLPGLGSVAGGGRYDNLIGAFGKEAVPAAGMSIGIDRLLSALEELGGGLGANPGSVLVFNLDRNLQTVYLTIVSELRASGIAAELYYEPEALEKQFKFAQKKGARLAVLVGSEELASGEVKLKELATRKQFAVKAEKLVGEVLKLLKTGLTH